MRGRERERGNKRGGEVKRRERLRVREREGERGRQREVERARDVIDEDMQGERTIEHLSEARELIRSSADSWLNKNH